MSKFKYFISAFSDILKFVVLLCTLGVINGLDFSSVDVFITETTSDFICFYLFISLLVDLFFIIKRRKV